MWWNNFIIAYRNLLKNKTASLINIFGLAIAIGCCIVVYLFLEMFYSMDTFHRDADRIFLVESLIDKNGEIETWCFTPRPMGPALKADFPQVEEYVRVNWGNGTFQFDDKIFKEQFWFVDSNYLDVFDFPLRYGNKRALREDNTLVLSEEAAIKYFGDENPIGKTLTLRLFGEEAETFTVGGVLEKVSTLSSFRINMLVPYEEQRDLGFNLEDWGQITAATYIRVNHPGVIPGLQEKLTPYLEREKAAKPELDNTGYAFDNLLDLTARQYKITGAIFYGMHPIALFVFPALAVLLLLLSCFNYVNISISQATRRLKEIGVRKVLGCFRYQLVAQFLFENLLVCLLALILGLYLAQNFLVPQLNTLFVASHWTTLELSLFGNIDLWIFLGAALLITSILSGAYPALYVASFQATSIFRGKQEIVNKNLLTHALLTFQFVLAFYAMTYGIITLQNAQYQYRHDLGYDPEDVAVIEVGNGDKYRVLAENLRRHADVLSVAGSQHLVGKYNTNALVDVAGEKFQSYRYNVGPGYFETIGMRLKDGRFFDERFGADAGNVVVVNETFVQEVGWENPVGQQFRVDDEAFMVVGVVEDFIYSDFSHPIEPVLFRTVPDEDYWNLTVRLRPDMGAKMVPFLTDTWKALFPEDPLEGYFMDTLLDGTFNGLREITQLAGFQAVMALLLSCLGMFGLVSQNIGRRTKEIGIRKALGASSLSVAGLVNRKFIFLLGLAALMAAPLSYLFTSFFLDSLYEYHTSIGPASFLLSYFLVFLTVALAVFTQIRRIVTMSPAQVLKTE